MLTLRQDRWDRSRRLEWFDVDAARRGRVLVVGAGALGNEVVKNLALSGVGHLHVVDPDRVDVTNLNRCAFFTRADADARREKARVLAERAQDLVEDCAVTATVAPVESLGPVAYADVDVAVCCVDNVAARLHVNAHARHHGVPVVDGGTHGVLGRVHVAWRPEDPCVECLVNRSHRDAVAVRYACTGREATVYAPPLAQEITTTSIVAAVQAREAVKVLLGLRDARQRGVLRYDGLKGAWDLLDAGKRPGCPHHAEDSD